MTYAPEHLHPYKRPQFYAGPDYFDYFPFLGQSRDSDALERLLGEHERARPRRDNQGLARPWRFHLCRAPCGLPAERRQRRAVRLPQRIDRYEKP